MTSDRSSQPISPLRARMIEDMTVRGFTEKTRQDYVRHVQAFVVFIGRLPAMATPEDIRGFQLHQRQSGIRPPSINDPARLSLRCAIADGGDQDLIASRKPAPINQRAGASTRSAGKPSARPNRMTRFSTVSGILSRLTLVVERPVWASKAVVCGRRFYAGDF
jgi:hypothetical protein